MTKENVAGRAGHRTTWTEQRMIPYTKRTDVITWAPQRKNVEGKVLCSHPGDPLNPKISSDIGEPSRAQILAEEAIDPVRAIAPYALLIEKVYQANRDPEKEVEEPAPQIDI